ncbi:hypothetical protein K491DRAFT_265557 [Lophiostoma macrostomum CBS 122681]|uniref:ABM domain-containing protein n=1 Tax=Lophiostoma macrostomum CBS 122681 TaxID=1314788 RepID=A0A6A6TGA5_9PLEO|nr:hypothetical protein K491DRAFT_265557 [Lophiostoma macrostomum CBS 122681]
MQEAFESSIHTFHATSTLSNSGRNSTVTFHLVTMAFALIPTPVHESQAKLDSFLSLINDIAEVTYANEPNNVSYCWFRKSTLDDCDGYECCGFEVYADEDALTQTHRASAEYKRMRSVAAEDGLFMRPTDLIFLEPLCENGFMVKESNDVRFGLPSTKDTLVVVRKYNTQDKDAVTRLTKTLYTLAEQAAGEDGLLSFMPLKRRDGISEISVLERYARQSPDGRRMLYWC